MIFLQMVNGLPQYPFAQPDAQTFPLSVILNETRTRSALVDEYGHPERSREDSVAKA
jgi:hypothetical protein